MKVFIASPLFNPQQHQIIGSIERLLSERGLEFYSARKHSGSDALSAEDRKDPKKWDPVFQSNLDGLRECDVMIAVLDYALPAGQSLALIDLEKSERPSEGHVLACLQIPDAGTVWEMGFFRARNKLVIGFSVARSRSHLNLMLTHGCDAFITGFENLEKFLSGNITGLIPPEIAKRYPEDSSYYRFNWEATHEFSPGTGGDVE